MHKERWNCIMRDKVKACVLTVISIFISVVIFYPFLFLLSSSFEKSSYVIRRYYTYSGGIIVPSYLSFDQYTNVLLNNTTFINSLIKATIRSAIISIFQVVFAVLASLSITRFFDRIKKKIIVIAMTIIIIPFQALEIPQYILFEKLHIENGLLRIYLLCLFNPLPYLLIYMLISRINKDIIGAAVLDGASYPQTILFVVIPQILHGMTLTFILLFVEAWNSVELPLVFEKEASKMPLSILLPQIIEHDKGNVFGYSILYILPTLLLFLSCESLIDYSDDNEELNWILK